MKLPVTHQVSGAQGCLAICGFPQSLTGKCSTEYHNNFLSQPFSSSQHSMLYCQSFWRHHETYQET